MFLFAIFTQQIIAQNRCQTLKTTENYQIGNLFSYLCINNNKVRIISKRVLRDFWLKHADSEQQLKSWYRETEKAQWNNINDLKTEYPNASILKENRIVFNIKGNNYRLIVKFNFEYQISWIRFIGTHAEYDKINANEI